MFTQYKYRLILVLLILALGIPFASKMLFRGKEIYPSIAMPGGVSTFKTEGKEMTFKSSRILGLDTVNHQLRPINHTDFVSPIPIHNMSAIMKNKFGLHHQNVELVKEARAFWGSKLTEQGCADSLFVVLNLKSYFPSGREEVIDKYRYELY